MEFLKTRKYISLVSAIFLCLLSVTLTSEKPKIHLIPYHEALFLESEDRWADSVSKTLSIDDKIAQLFVAEYNTLSKTKKLVDSYHLGGVRFASEENGALVRAVTSNQSVPLFVIACQDALRFTAEKKTLPEQSALGHISDDAQFFEVGKLIGSKLKADGINFFIGGYANLEANSPYSYGTNKYHVSRLCMQLHEGIGAAGLLSASGLFPYAENLAVSQKEMDTTYLLPFRRLIANGLPGMVISPHVFASTNNRSGDSLLTFHSAENILRKRLDFEGIVLSYMPDSTKEYVAEQALESIVHGANLVLNVHDIPFAISYIKDAYEKGDLSKRLLNARCKKNLQAKSWLQAKNKQETRRCSVVEEAIVLKTLAKESVTILKNDNKYLPFSDLLFRSFAHVHFGSGGESVFCSMLSKYVEFSHFSCQEQVTTDSLADLIAKLSGFENVVVSVDETWKSEEVFSSALSILGSQAKVTLVAFGKQPLLERIDFFSANAVVLVADYGWPSQDAVAQILFGALPAKGVLPTSYLGFDAYYGIRYPSNSRLQYALPEEKGMSSAILAQIDSIAEQAVLQQATPGCQVLVARKGAVVYEKSFGYYTFDKKQPVTNASLYDLASITKVAASTVSLMRLTDESRFELSEPLDTYLPYLDSTNKGDLLLSDILTHQARLHPWIPFYLTLITGYDDPEVDIISTKESKEFSVRAGNNFYIRTGYSFRDSLLSDTVSDLFSIEVAKDVYLNKWFVDSMFCRIDQSKLREKKEYKYSDLGYYYIKKLIEDITGVPLQKYVDSVFYQQLGAHRMGYLPLERFGVDEIVPTEDDPIFRRQLLQGYVHDPGAAMLGGVGGHAGLFSNANDLAKLLQMLLNGGVYGNKMFLYSTTIDKYTSCPYCAEGNRRGFGFDKPNPDPDAVSPVCENASPHSFGHTGFTGTIVWADPDEELIYIFLSNRICPTSDNKKIYALDVRPSIQRVLYNAIQSE